MLREAPIRGPPHNPGQGGWPTIRYFNKDTGVDGAAYVQKTGQRVCQELGDIEMLSAYVRDVSSASGASGSTSAPASSDEPEPEPEAPKAPPCDVAALDKCDEREQMYVVMYRSKSLEQQKVALKRLQDLIVNSELGSQESWALKRAALLKQLVAAGEKTPSHDEL